LWCWGLNPGLTCRASPVYIPRPISFYLKVDLLHTAYIWVWCFYLFHLYLLIGVIINIKCNYFSFSSFQDTWVWTQGLRLARQALYNFSHAVSPVLVIFEIGCCFMSGLAWTSILLCVCVLPSIAGDDRRLPLCPPIGWDGVLNFLHRLFSNDPPNFCLPSSWDYRCEPLAPHCSCW
jgi:hypothetical protein